MRINATNTGFNPITITVESLAEATVLHGALRAANIPYAADFARAVGIRTGGDVRVDTPAATTTATAGLTDAGAPFEVGDVVRVVRGDGRKLPVGVAYTVTEVLPPGTRVTRRSGEVTTTKWTVRLDPSEVNYRDPIAWDADRFTADDNG